MINLPEYEIKDQIFKGNKSTIFRGVRNSDGISIIIKVLANEYPTIKELASFRREYEIATRLTGNKIINVYNLKNYSNSLAIIMEDFGGKSLADLLILNKFSLEKKLSLAVDITDALMQIHRQNIIHKDINPSNIVWNMDTNQLKVIDFGISSDLSIEKHQNLCALDGTLLYVSPEQTGKVNRIIDYRSDLYSLGVTLYEIFTEKLPFTGDDAEIIYGHIAKIPEEPKKVNHQIPSAISDIIMKLMAKNAEDRYQSLLGLKDDLVYCLENFKISGRIINFEIAQKDISRRFQIPQKLYGREKELDKLIQIFEALQTSEVKLLLVSGYSGIGKTSIIREMYQIIINKGGYFISGKFNKLEGNNPYSAIIAAFRDLLKNLILEYKNIEVWKKKLLDTLGSNGKIIVELIPELKQIIGDQPEIPKLSPTEEKNRFQMVFRDFIKAFATKEHPLVIFLDDLQWSDFSTTDFLKYLLTSMELNNLLIIGAFRDNEVKQGHHFLLMLDEVKNALGNSNYVNQIFLEPLQEHTVNQMVSDTLKRHHTDTVLLSSYIYRKTKGNPFFINQLLNLLYQKGVFYFNEDTLQWDWKRDEIAEIQVSDNVVGFLIATLNLLPQDSLEVIKWASCIGNSFDLKTLYLISNETANIADALWILIENEFIIPLNNNYRLLHMPKEEFIQFNMEIRFRFSHDRIQQAAYLLISDDDKLLIHQEIGKLLLHLYTDQNNLDDNIFEVINHLNIAKDLIEKKDERIELMELHYSAGKKAKANTAYDIANNFFKISKTLLTEEEWTECPGKLFELSYEFAESNFLAGNLEEAIGLCNDLFEVTTDNIEKARVYSLKAKILEFQGEKKVTVIEEIRKGLSLLDVDLPTDAAEIDRKLGEGIGKMVEWVGSVNNFV